VSLSSNNRDKAGGGKVVKKLLSGADLIWSLEFQHPGLPGQKKQQKKQKMRKKC